jgi:hypothetical protein
VDDSLLQFVPLICAAIEPTRMLRLIYRNKERTIEPHDHGVLNGSLQPLGYQVASFGSHPLPNWLMMKTDEIIELDLLARTFPGGRPTHQAVTSNWKSCSSVSDPPVKAPRPAPLSPLHCAACRQLTQEEGENRNELMYETFVSRKSPSQRMPRTASVDC